MGGYLRNETVLQTIKHSEPARDIDAPAPRMHSIIMRNVKFVKGRRSRGDADASDAIDLDKKDEKDLEGRRCLDDQTDETESGDETDSLHAEF